MDTTQINRELVISSDVSEVKIVLLEDKQLVELHKEQKNNNISVGDVYMGRIKKILPGLNSAFVDIGCRKDAFLHYLDLGPQIQSLKKFTKFAEEGNNAQLNMDVFSLEKDIDKSGKIFSLWLITAQSHNAGRGRWDRRHRWFQSCRSYAASRSLR